MLDIKAIRSHPDQFKVALARKGVAVGAIDEVLKFDEVHRGFLGKVEELAARQNDVSKEIPGLEGTRKAKLLGEMKGIADKKKVLGGKLEKAEAALRAALEVLPNPPDDKAPDGKDDSENTVVSTWGEKTKFDFEPKEHWEIAENLGILDTERSAKVSGARFYYLRNDLALLQMALMNWAFLEVSKRGYSATIPPFLTRKEAIYGTGYLDRDENYVVNPGDDDLFLIGTSEVPMVSYYAGEILEEGDLPGKFCAYSPCFRKEAGSYGKDMKGILRVHQFEKIEMVIFCLPEDAVKLHEEIREVEENLLQLLQIPYQVVNVCCGDLGNSASKKYDLEAWLPGQGKFREMTSTSICTDFQSRRLNIRIRRKSGEIVPAYILNGTAVSSRPLIAILENFQQEDGSVVVPEVLRPFCGGLSVISN